MRDVTAMWQEIVDIKNKIEAEEQKGGEGNPELLNQWRQEVKDLEDIIADTEKAQLAEEQNQRVLEKQSIVDTYVDTLSAMFEALLPSAVFRPLFGLNEYEEKRAQFYQLSQAYTGDAIDKQHEKNEELLATKDERIKLLNNQSLTVQNQLDESVKTVQSLHEEIWSQKSEHDDYVSDLKEQLKTVNKQLAEGKAAVFENGTLRQTIAELEEKLEAAKQPTEEVKSSVSVNEVINQIKSKNELSANDWAARWNARQKDDAAKLDLPEVVQQEQPFQPNEADKSNAGNVQDMATHEAPPVEGPQFPTTTGVGPIAIPVVEGQPSHQMDGTPATQEWVKAQMAELEARITGEKAA